jgi:shikimate kinase
MRPVIALVGARGAGKTTVGALLAARLGWTFVDTDALVQAHLDQPISALFAAGREADFRAAEAAAVAEALAGERVVVATGGGAVLDPVSRERLAGVFTAWLQAPPATLAARTAGSGRPSLTTLGPVAEATRMLTERQALYAACAALAVDTEGRTPAEVVEALLLAWRQAAEARP